MDHSPLASCVVWDVGTRVSYQHIQQLPNGGRADALRAWVAARPAGYAPPAVAGEHPLVAIRAVPIDSWVRVVSATSAGEIVTRPTRKGGDARSAADSPSM